MEFIFLFKREGINLYIYIYSQCAKKLYDSYIKIVMCYGLMYLKKDSKLIVVEPISIVSLDNEILI